MFRTIMDDTRQISTVSRWLLLVCLLIIVMVAVGGATRLTESGLSIVEWKPVVGVIPPRGQDEWQAEFQKYQYSPQFRKVNRGMTLDQFKKIYFWEYLHRFAARLVGLVFLLPYLYFFLRGMIPQGVRLKLFGAFVLGGLQGVLGWYMVRSGLVDRPDVSHFRLAAHLMLAFLVLGYLYWIYLDLTESPKTAVHDLDVRSFAGRLKIFVLLFIVQVIWGAFTAGLNAGFVYNTFPHMGEGWVPAAIFEQVPWWSGFLSGVAGVQFMHRLLGWTVLFYAFVLYIHCGRHVTDEFIRKGVVYLVLLVVLQFLLGVVTILTRVNIPMAILHQVNAAFVLMAIIYVYHQVRRVL